MLLSLNWSGEAESNGDDAQEAFFFDNFLPTLSCSYTERIPRLRHKVTMTEDFCAWY
jgi:hypothetical protein